jgi:hypothetical protein
MTKLKRKMIDRVVDVLTSKDPVLESLRQNDQDKLERLISMYSEKKLLAMIPENERYSFEKYM